MQRLAEVEEARALMTEALTWSVMTWLREKKRVRKTADRANDALDALNREIKAAWSADLKAAYDQLAAEPANSGPVRRQPARGGHTVVADAELMAIAKRVKEADDAARRARMDAEETFDEAERQLSTSLAREGCQKAIHSWDLHEKAARKAEAALRPDRAGA